MFNRIRSGATWLTRDWRAWVTGPERAPWICLGRAPFAWPDKKAEMASESLGTGLARAYQQTDLTLRQFEGSTICRTRRRDNALEKSCF